jgi:hypothetical protein
MPAQPEFIENGFLRVTSSDLGDGGTGSQSRRGANTLKFQSMPPELGTSKSAEFTPVPIIGRANPLWVYGSSGERAWNLELKFFVVSPPTNFSEREEGAGLSVDQVNEACKIAVTDKINWCEALVYPIIKNGLSQGPPTIQFVFGDLINVNCICTDVQTSYPGPWYIKSVGNVGWPMYGIVNVTLKQIGGGSISYRDVRDNLHNSPRRA